MATPLDAIRRFSSLIKGASLLASVSHGFTYYVRTDDESGALETTMSNPLAASEINEGVAFLNHRAPKILDELTKELPSIASLISTEGIHLGGGSKEKAAAYLILVEKAKFFLRVLEVARQICENAARHAAVRIDRGEKYKSVSSVLSIIGASSVLGSIGLGPPRVTVLASALTLAATLATHFSDRVMQVRGTGGKLSEAYRNLTRLLYEVGIIENSLDLAVQFGASTDELTRLIRDANQCCQKINEDAAGVLDRLVPVHALRVSV